MNINCSHCKKTVDVNNTLDLADVKNLCPDCWYILATNSGILGLLDYIGSIASAGARDGME